MNNTNKLFSYDHDISAVKLSLSVANIHQISELSIIRGTEIPWHNQYCDEITYVVSGRAMIYSEKEIYPISRSQIHFIKKGVSHRIVADKNENFRYICIGFTPNENNPDISKIVKKLHESGNFVTHDNGNLRILTEMLINESYIQSPEINIMINAYMLQIMTEVYRTVSNEKFRNTNNKFRNTHSNSAIYHTLKYIDKNFLKIEKIKDISQNLSYSEYYLAHLFKEKTGTTIKEYILSKKISLAKELLKSENTTVREVSEKLGYSSVHSFSNSFRKLTGKSPAQYKKAQIYDFESAIVNISK